MTTSLSANRRDAEEIRPFHAPTSLFDDLQKVLVDLIELHLQGKQAHWNLVGTKFRDLHLQLDELVDAADASTADLLHGIIDALEREAWLLKSENGAA